MKGNRAVLTAVVVLVLVIAGWWLFKRKGGARARRPDRRVRDRREASVDRHVRSARRRPERRQEARDLHACPTSRITWKVQVPDDAWLKLSLGMKPESWEKEGDGVLFRIGVSDGRAFEDLITQHVDPYNNKADRRWIPLKVDLSAYAGEKVELILNTNTSPKGKGDDPRNDTALWGAPEIVIR